MTTDISFSPWAKSRGARVRRLTLLAPDIVEAILGGWQPAGLQLKALLRRFPVGWQEQRVELLSSVESRSAK
jgi:hypothetical protein